MFPNGKGNPENLGNIIRRGLWPAMLTAGLCDPAIKDGKPLLDDEGDPVMKARYSGLHCLRHFYASWLINRKADGGCELPLKTVQDRMGHSGINLTADTYGHLFPSESDEH